MANGIYVAASGAMARIQELDVLANNLANANTVGFKRDQVSFQSVRAATADGRPIDKDKEFVQTRESKPDLSAGPLTRTDNPLDVAIEGPAMLRVRTPRGERFTRNGRMMIGRDGLLRTLTGDLVLGTDGHAISIPPGKTPEIDPEGRISVAQALPDTPHLLIGRLGLIRVPPGANLRKDGAGLFMPGKSAMPAGPRGAPPPTATGSKVATGALPTARAPISVLQGFVEDANVQPVQVIMNLIDVQRTYQALHQAIHAYSIMDQEAAKLPT